MAKHNKKPKHRELEFEIKILWFKLKFKHIIEWQFNKGSTSFLPLVGCGYSLTYLVVPSQERKQKHEMEEVSFW